MKKLVMAAAVLGAFAGTAQAQTSVTLYGIADGDVRFDHTNIGTLRSIGSGGESGSRWGIRGSEDLGGGLKANFIFEQGFQLDDNSSAQGNTGGGATVPPGAVGGTNSASAKTQSSGSRLFGRTATVSLSGNFGELRIGRQYTPLFLNQATADPFGAGMVGQTSNLYVNLTVRNDNAIYYDTPKFAGVQASFGYELGESTTNITTPVAGGQAKRGGDRYEAGLSYAAGPIYAGVAYEQVRSNFDDYRLRTADAAGTYDFGFLKVHLIYFRTKSDNGTGVNTLGLSTVKVNENAYSAGVTVPFGAWTFLGSYNHLRDKSTSNVPGVNLGTPRANFYSVGTRYSFSKRTILYASYGRMNLKNGSLGNPFQGYGGIGDASNNGLYTTANLTGPTGAPNVNPYSYQFGIRHSF